MNHPRRDYGSGELDERVAGTDPFTLFATWLHTASADSRIDESYAMTLATADATGSPAARIVLLRDHGTDGFVFFTNYDSRKGDELNVNPRAALVFYWGPLERQIRIEGEVERVSVETSDAYFASRPRKSQIASMVSRQSRPSASRDGLEARFVAAETELGEATPARPGNWGGYRLVPRTFEFWQGRRSRLHDRIVFSKRGASWDVGRLDP